MSDLFIGEILVLFLLLPVLVRPFSRRLQRLHGLPLLPLLALLLCAAIVAGMGLRLTFLPILILSAIVFIFGLIRLFRLFRGLPTDWYPPMSIAWNSFLAALFVGTVALTFIFAPESGYMADVRVERTMTTRPEGRGMYGHYAVWNSSLGSAAGASATIAAKPVLLLLGDVSSAIGGRSTGALVLAEAGYTVIAANFSGPGDYRNPLVVHPSVRQYATLSGRVFAGKPYLTDFEEVAAAQERELKRLIVYARELCGDAVPLYALAEGSAAPSLFNFVKSSPEALSGAVAIMNASNAASLPPVSGGAALPGGYAVLDGIDGMMPALAGNFRVLVISGADKGLYGFGEIASDDVLAAALLGGARDVQRKNAELMARRIASWLSDRRTYDRH